MEESVSKALLLYYLNSDIVRFGEYREFFEDWKGVEPDVAKIVEAVQNKVLTPAEKAKLVTEFSDKYSFTERLLMACACCGVRRYCVDADDYPLLSIDKGDFGAVKFSAEQEKDRQHLINVVGEVAIPLREPIMPPEDTQVDKEEARKFVLDQFEKVSPYDVVSAVHWDEK